MNRDSRRLYWHFQYLRIAREYAKSRAYSRAGGRASRGAAGNNKQEVFCVDGDRMCTWNC
jgi:hypothetical protein